MPPRTSLNHCLSLLTLPSAIHKARKRLGPLPIAWLFEATAQSWAHTSAAQHKFQGPSVSGVDGTTLRVPDSPDNREHFGGTPMYMAPEL